MDGISQMSTTTSAAMQSCRQFAAQLFHGKGWKDIPNEIMLMSFSWQLTAKVAIRWNAICIYNRLYIHVPLQLNKTSFVALLDYAQKELKVSWVITCHDRDRQDFRDIVKAFRFIGFEHVTPDHPTVAFSEDAAASLHERFHFMSYELD